MKRRSLLKAGLGSCAAGALLPGCSNNYQQCEQNAEGDLLLQRTQFDLARGPKPYLLLEHPASRYPISLWQLDHQNFSACLMKCAHQACQTNPRSGPRGDQYVCPCHGSRYDNRGTLLQGPASSDLSSYPVRLAGEGIIIALT